MEKKNKQQIKPYVTVKITEVVTKNVRRKNNFSFKLHQHCQLVSKTDPGKVHVAGLRCEEEKGSSVLNNTNMSPVSGRCLPPIVCQFDLIVCVNINCSCEEVTLCWRNPCKQIQP